MPIQHDQESGEALPPSQPADPAEDVEAAIVLRMYPHDKYRGIREGRMTVQEFAADLLRDVDAGIAARRVGISRS